MLHALCTTHLHAQVWRLLQRLTVTLHFVHVSSGGEVVQTSPRQTSLEIADCVCALPSWDLPGKHVKQHNQTSIGHEALCALKVESKQYRLAQDRQGRPHLSYIIRTVSQQLCVLGRVQAAFQQASMGVWV